MKLSGVLRPLMCIAFVLLNTLNGFSQTRGTVDGGGANGLNSKLIESYKVKSSDLPTSQLIQPMMDFLRNLQRYDSGNEYRLDRYYSALKNIIEKHTWYIVPVDVPDLGTERHGIPFSTDQFAIQKGREVFILADKFKQAGLVSALEQEKIILHELFMGLKILMKMDSYTQCVYTASNYNCNEETDPALDSLNPTLKEHLEVRQLTNFITEMQDKLGDLGKEKQLLYEFIKELDFNHFRNKFLKVQRQGSAEILANTIAKIIQTQTVIKENVLYCNHWETNSKEQIEKLKLKWDSSKKGTKISFKAKFKVKLVVEEQGELLKFKVMDMNNRTLESVTRKKGDLLYGYNLNNDQLRDVLSRDNKTTEYYLEEKKPEVLKLGQQYRSVRIEANVDTKEIIAYRSSNVVVSSVESNGAGGSSSSHRYFDKMNCTNKEIVTYTK